MQIFLVALSRNGQNFATPRVVAVNDEFINVVPARNSKKTKVIETIGNEVNTYSVYDSIGEIEAQSLVARGQQANVMALSYVTLALAAAGATAAAAADVTEYFTEVTSATAATTDGIQLDAATVGKVRVVLNSTAVVLDVWPQTGENFLGSADDAATTQAVKSRKHYFCRTASVWEIATDYTG